MRMIAAIATDDGITTNQRHFGDAAIYNIYEIDEEGHRFLKKIDNSSEIEEESHADPRKARSVAEMLSAENVNIAVAQVFGPNLKRIKSKFVCIIVKDLEISAVIQKVKSDYTAIEEEWKKGSERSHLRLT